MHHNEYLMHFFYAVGDEIDENEAHAYLGNLLDNGIVTQREAVIVSNAISNAALSGVSPESKNALRAQIFRHVLLSLMQ